MTKQRCGYLETAPEVEDHWYLCCHFWYFNTGVGNLFTITDRINCGLSLAGRKYQLSILKFYLCLTMRDGGFLLRLTVSTWLSWSFVLTWFCTLNRVTKMIMRAMSNIHGGRRFPTPLLTWYQMWCSPINFWCLMFWRQIWYWQGCCFCFPHYLLILGWKKVRLMILKFLLSISHPNVYLVIV